MGLGSRTARHHESALQAEAGIDSSKAWDFQPGQAVMTVDGFRGVVAAVLDGPIAGTESYEVNLTNGMGGGEYTASQLHALSDVTGTVHRTAADDYPELGTVLEDRPDIARNTVLASRRDELKAELSATAAEVDDALDVPGAADMLSSNETGPTKYSSLRAQAESDHVQHFMDWAKTNGNDPDELSTLLKYEKQPGVGRSTTNRIADEYHLAGDDWRSQARTASKTDEEKAQILDAARGKFTVRQVHDIVTGNDTHGATVAEVALLKQHSGRTAAADHQTVDGTECQEGTEPGIDEHGHLTWNGHAPQGDSDGYHTAAHDHSTVDALLGCPSCSQDVGPTFNDRLDEENVGERLRGVGGEHANWLLDQQSTGPGKYSKLDHDHDWEYIGTGIDNKGAYDFEKCNKDGCGGVQKNHKYKLAFHTGAEMMREAAQDADFRFHVTASWADVRAKAKRIRSEGGVHITLSTEGMVYAEVKGDTNVYEAGLQRLPSRQAIAAWTCGCKWGAYHWGAGDDMSRFAGRMCSHALALQYEAQSRGMFGRPIGADDSKPSWAPRKVVVKYDIDEGRNVRAPATTAPGDYARIAALSPMAVLLIASAREHTLAATALAMDKLGFHEEYLPRPMLEHLGAVNNAWGEPAPNVLPQLPGPTMPPDKNANPADTGWASSPDPTTWDQAVPDNQVDRMTAAVKEPTFIAADVAHDAEDAAAARAAQWSPNTADLHEDPEPALPSTDGSDDSALDPFGSAGDIGDPTSLEPEDPSFVSTGSQRPRFPGTEFPDPYADDKPEPEHLPISVGGWKCDVCGREVNGQTDENGRPLMDGDSVRHTGSLEDAEDVGDIVAQFQATAGAQQLQGGGGADSGEIAQMAMATLQGMGQKTALKDFTPGEQAQIINEGSEGVRARNFDGLNLTGTHYENLEAALSALDEEADDGGWLS